MTQSIPLLVIVFFAVFTQSLTGFGSGLVSMALMPNVLDIQSAVPLVAMLTGTLELFLLIRYRAAFNYESRLEVEHRVDPCDPHRRLGFTGNQCACAAACPRVDHGSLFDLCVAQF